MFFSDKIKNIKPNDNVLEIGPGADPHPRSNVLLEIKLANEKEYAAQFGHEKKLATDKKIVFYDGKKFPFSDNEFDYIICSHVLEHVDNVELFLSEVFRVAKRGYFEYPLIYYDYLYNFDVHVNYLKYDGMVLKYMKKKDSHLDEFLDVQDFFLQSLRKNHSSVLNELIHLFMEGFEWGGSFSVTRTSNIKDVCHNSLVVPEARVAKTPTAIDLFKQFVKKLISG